MAVFYQYHAKLASVIMIRKIYPLLLSMLLGFVVAFFFLVGVDEFFGVLNLRAANEELTASVIVSIQEPEAEEEVVKPVNNGLLMFRGNKERNFYGTGPIPENPKIAWRYPSEPMCSYSSSLGVTSQWCGTGWTGQPVVWEREDGITEIIFGAYDGAIHFVNADTGKKTRNKFQTGDIIKGSFALDPDGYPLLYGGSRDNKMRIISLDQGDPVELWAMDSEELPEGIWNNDWDANPVIHDDMLYEGGENGWFYVVKLNRNYDSTGKVSVSPEIIFEYAGFNDELIEKVGPNLSMENSPLLLDGVVYVANSGGRIMGFDIEKIKMGGDALVFDFWVGDDVDATLVSDEEGMIYVAVEEERFNARSEEIGQLVKLNPKKKNPLVWSISLPSSPDGLKAGLWATPAIHKDYLYVSTHLGELLVVNKNTGDILWRDDIGFHAWSSPSVVDETLIVGTCKVGGIRAYDISSPARPELLWNKKVGEGCVESTPAIWNGEMFVGNRDGFFYKIH